MYITIGEEVEMQEKELYLLYRWIEKKAPIYIKRSRKKRYKEFCSIMIQAGYRKTDTFEQKKEEIEIWEKLETTSNQKEN